MAIFKPILYWVWFLDSGNVITDKNKLGHVPVDFGNFYCSTGGGIKVQIPFFPIRLYMARRFKMEDWKYTERPGDNNWEFVFAIGGPF